MPTWPASLPQKPLVDGYSEEPKSRVLRSQMDAGPPKTRQRFTAGVTDIPVNMTLSIAQLATFEAWFNADIQGGSLPFDMSHPRADEVVSMMIVPPYQLNPVGVGDQYWRLSMALEVQP